MPTQLLQVLRPFGRPTDDDDARFVAALCLPEFRTAHTGYAEARSKVLGILAHDGDLDIETAVSLLANEVLNRLAEGDLPTVARVVGVLPSRARRRSRSLSEVAPFPNRWARTAPATASPAG